MRLSPADLMTLIEYFLVCLKDDQTADSELSLRPEKWILILHLRSLHGFLSIREFILKYCCWFMKIYMI